MPAPKGRPARPETRQALIDSATALIRELGYDQVSVDAIAENAHASKRTIYRLWGSKARLVADAVRTGALPLPQVPIADTGDLRADLIEWLAVGLDYSTDPRTASVFTALIAEQATVAGTEASMTNIALAPTEFALASRLESAKTRGEIRPDTNIDAVVDLIIGAQTMGTLQAAPLTIARTIGWIDSLLTGISTQDPA
jgi:AcrR family transcriptional regulator